MTSRHDAGDSTVSDKMTPAETVETSRRDFLNASADDRDRRFIRGLMLIQAVARQ
jgi:hypothetical protein